MSNRDKLELLLKAVLTNTMRPSAKEMEKIKVDKKILTSPKYEGDSKVGMILFCGIASVIGVRSSETMDFLGIEGEPEYGYKIGEYARLSSESKEFNTKITLINNYFKLN